MATMDTISTFVEEIARHKTQVRDYLFSSPISEHFRPAHIQDAVFHYLNMSGKMLRPAVLLLSCGAVGGDTQAALPAAAMIELYHTWTLVHDDIIDRDEKRRGITTVHTEFATRAKTDLKWQTLEAKHYGTSIALLAGDLQQAWVWSLLFELNTKNQFDPQLIVQIGTQLAGWLQPNLIEGQTLDIQYSKNRANEINEAMILDMLWKKTGALYEFAGRTGATLGLHSANHPYVEAIGKFCSRCGLAFQLQDDILGVIGEEDKTGKPFGSDIREGKHTVIALNALARANEAETWVITATLGNQQATRAEIQRVINIFQDLGAITYVENLAKRYIDEALDAIRILPDSQDKNLLCGWADYMINRSY